MSKSDLEVVDLDGLTDPLWSCSRGPGLLLDLIQEVPSRCQPVEKVPLGLQETSPAMFSDFMEPGTAGFGSSEGGRLRRFPRVSAPESQESLDVLPRSDHEGL